MQNDESDRHVLAAAARSRRDVIVTWNKAHFPLDACAPCDIEFQDPDEFRCDLWTADQSAMAQVLTLQVVNRHEPSTRFWKPSGDGT